MKARITRTSDRAWFGGNPDKPPHESAKWDEEKREWFCEVKTIEDVLSFGDKIVFSWAGMNDSHQVEIEIYDDYRE